MTERSRESGRDATTVRDIQTFGRAITIGVQDIVLGADPALADGTPQTVGDYTVTISLSTAGEDGETRTTYTAEKDGLPMAEYSKISTADAVTVSDQSTLYGEVDGARVALTLSRGTGRPGHVSVSVPNPDQVLPGRRHSMPPGAHNPVYITRVRKAFGIPQ